LGVDIFGRNRWYQTLSMRVKLLRVGEIVAAGRVKDKVMIERELGMQLNMAEYFRLRNIITEIIRMDKCRNMSRRVHEKQKKGVAGL